MILCPGLTSKNDLFYKISISIHISLNLILLCLASLYKNRKMKKLAKNKREEKTCIFKIFVDNTIFWCNIES